MAIITMKEYESEKVSSLRNCIYNRIQREIAKKYGWSIAERIMQQFGQMTVKELSCNSMFNVMACVKVI